MRKQVTTIMAATQKTMSRKITKLSAGRFRSTFPRGLARAVSLAERDTQAVKFDIRCADSGLTLAVTFGSHLEQRGENVMTPIIHSSGQVELEFPIFQAEAWNLADVEIDWPDADEVSASEEETVTITAPLQNWEPKYDVDMFAASGGFAYGSAITMSGEDRTNIESHFPMTLAESAGLAEPQQRAEITFDCVDGRKVLVATPTDEPRKERRNSVSVNLAGARDRQARFSAGRIVNELGIRDTLEAGDSVPLRWFSQNGSLIGFVRDEEGDD